MVVLVYFSHIMQHQKQLVIVVHIDLMQIYKGQQQHKVVQLLDQEILLDLDFFIKQQVSGRGFILN